MTIYEQLLSDDSEKISFDNDLNLQRFFSQIVNDADYNEILCNNMKTKFGSYFKQW